MSGSQSPADAGSDQEIHNIASKFPDLEDVQDAAFVLSFILQVIRQEDPLDPESVTLAACEESLSQNPEVYEALKLAHTQKKYDAIRKWGLLQRPKTPPAGVRSSQDLELDTKVKEFLDKLRPAMKKFVHGDISLPQWSLDPNTVDPSIAAHIMSLKIPKLNSKPNVLLHDLGRFKDDPILKSRLDNIFTEGKNTFFVNTSGSGKTRLVFEGLCQNWGFYFTSVIDSSLLGSGDIDRTIHDYIPRSANFYPELPPADKQEYDRALRANREVANRRFSEVLLARLLIFHLFAEIMHLEGMTAEHKQRWLLLQLRPYLLDSQDIFEVLTLILTEARNRYIDSNIVDVLLKARRLCSPPGTRLPHLFCILDEAQVAGATLSSAFMQDDEKCPILREVVRAWEGQTRGRGVSLIIAGTQISKRLFEESKQTYRWCSETGAFDDRDAQKRYMFRYLPPALSDSPAGDQLSLRLWRWLHGRHRFTAGFISVLLQNAFQKPNTLLDEYIKNFTNFQPADAQEVVKSEGPFHTIRGINYHTLDFSILDEDLLLKSTIHDVLFHYLVTSGSPPPFAEDSINLVSYGFGRFLDPDTLTITLDEPLVLMAAAQWFNDNDVLANHKDHRGDANLNSKDFKFYLAFHLVHAFDGKRQLSDVFTFRDRAHTWAKQKVDLVKLHRADGDSIEEEIIGSSDFTGSPKSLGTIASTLKKTFSWLDHQHHTPFCFPHPSFGPDLIFVLRLADGCFIWVVLKISIQSKPLLPKSELRDTIRGVTVSKFFYDKDGDPYSTDEYPTPSEDVLKSLKGLPNPSSNAGKFSLLRVVVSYPAETRLARSRDEDSDKHPIASLNVDLFDEIMEDITSTRLLEGITAKVLGIPKDIPKTMAHPETEDTEQKQGKRPKRARRR